MYILYYINTSIVQEETISNIKNIHLLQEAYISYVNKALVGHYESIMSWINASVVQYDAILTYTNALVL